MPGVGSGQDCGNARVRATVPSPEILSMTEDGGVSNGSGVSDDGGVPCDRGMMRDRDGDETADKSTGDGDERVEVRARWTAGKVRRR